MPNRFVDPVPTQFQPAEEDNYPSFGVIRGVYSKEMTVSNFLPTYIERPSILKSFVPPSASTYALSIFSSLEECKKALGKYPRLFDKIVGFAEGDTNIDRGIATKPGKEGHIDYFLYDYAGNNPCQDFHYLCDK